jgi:hypothetical protein
MKNLKLFITAFTIIFAVLVVTANESHKKTSEPIHTGIVEPIYHKTTFELKKINCMGHESSTVSDIEMREEYNTLHEEKDALLDFNTNNYLPEDFNAYNEDESNLVAHELLNEEADAPFDFNSSDYLPLNFYASK